MSHRPPVLPAWRWLVRRARWGLLAAWAMGLGLWGLGAQAAVLALSDEQAVTEVWPAVTLRADPDLSLTLADVMARPDLLRSPDGQQATLGVRHDAVWLRVALAVAPGSDGLWALELDYPVLQQVEAYLSRDGRVERSARLGSLVPQAERPLPGRAHLLPLKLQPGASYELWLRVQTAGAMVLPMRLYKPPALLARSLAEQMLQGVLGGIAFCLLVYSLGQWWNLREPLFLQYALLVAGTWLFSLHLFGVGAQYLWPGRPWFETHAAGLSSLMATCGSFLFIGQALSEGQPRSRFLWGMRAGAVLAALCAGLHALDALSTRQVAAIVSGLGLLPALAGIVPAWRRARQGDEVGGTLLVTWLVYFLGTATVIGVIQGWLPVHFWTLHAFQFGATLDLLLFMRVLGLRTRAIRRAALDTARERDAMRSLAHTDPLTGLLNRRGLDEALAMALAERREHEVMALYLMDLDGFKPVNDVHGHDAGDRALQAVAHRLLRNLRHDDVVARLGGDEFVVLIRHLVSQEQSEALGQQLVEAFREPFDVGGQRVVLGVTVGYALAPQDGGLGAELLKRADVAMYEGKQAGKFCLRRYGAPAGAATAGA